MKKVSLGIFLIITAFLVMFGSIYFFTHNPTNNPVEDIIPNIEHTEENFNYDSGSGNYLADDKNIQFQTKEGIFVMQTLKEYDYITIYFEIEDKNKIIIKTSSTTYNYVKSRQSYSFNVMNDLSFTEMLSAHSYRISRITFKRS